MNSSLVEKVRSVKPLPLFLLAISTIIYFVALIIGAVRWYSPVPFWDMWDSYIWFYYAMHKNGWSEFFHQANEHRIIFTRILFWLDIRFFHGRSVLLIATNLVLVMSIWLSLAASAKRLLPGKLSTVLILAIATPCFSWMQESNITWANQSQFFAAYLFPLLAFQCLAMSTERTFKWFIAALWMGLASLGTMANGIIVLPMMFIMYVLSKGPTLKRGLGIALVSIVGMSMWLHNYQISPHERASISGFAAFATIFLGSPFVHVFNNQLMGYVGGFAFLSLSAFFLVDWCVNRDRRDAMALALIMFCGYVCVAAVAAASGRAFAGIDAALVGRYTTPSLLGWSAMAILVTYRFRRRTDIVALATLSAAFVSIALFPIQAAVVADAGPAAVHTKMTAALAIRMRVNDLETIGYIYPMDTIKYRERLEASARAGETMNISIFSSPGLSAAASAIGKNVSDVGAGPCNGNVDLTNHIPADPRFVRVEGWALDAKGRRTFEYVLLESGGKIVGAGVTGSLRPDVADVYGRFARRSGYTAFLLSSAVGQKISILCPGLEHS